MKPRSNIFALITAIVFTGSTSPAAVANHEFAKLPTVKTLSGTSGVVTFTTGANTFTCASSVTKGEITQMDTIGKLSVKFTGCRTSNGGPRCTIKSVGAVEGEIAMQTLKGQLGSVKTTEATSGIGLLLSPATGTKWTTLAANACTPETSMNGTLAGEVTPVKASQSTNKLTFAVTAGIQGIKFITVLGVVKTAELELFALAGTLEQSNELTYGGPVEVI